MAKKVLLIDDDRDMVLATKMFVEAGGFIVDTAYDGEEGLKKVKTFKPDLIVLDVMMPGTNGWDVCADIKEDRESRHIPVIMLTGIGKRLGTTFSTQDIYDFLGIEPDVYLEKPVDPIFLRRVTGRLLGTGSPTNGRGT